MGTLSIELESTWNESLGRRRVGSRYYAGLPATGYQEQVVTLAPGVQVSIVPPVTPLVSILIAVDVGTSVVLGWVLGDITTEIPVTQISLLTPPAGASLYVRNAGVSGTSPVPTKIVSIY